MPASLRHTLLQALGGPTVLLLLVGGGIAYAVSKSVIGTAYDQNLLNLASGVANHIQLKDGSPRLTPEAEVVLRTDTLDTIFFRVRDERGVFLAGDADLPLAAEPAPVSGGGLESMGGELPVVVPSRTTRLPVFFDATYHDEPIRGVRLYWTREQHGYYVTVAETLFKRNEAMGTLLLGFASASLMIVLAAVVAARFGIPSGLAPLARLTRDLANRSGTDLSPIEIESVPMEIRSVVTALNALLGRLREANGAQRQFLQDAAHQLRTPLAGLQMQIELMGNRPSDPEAMSRLQQSVRRVTRLANQLLALARAEAGDRLMGDALRLDLAELIDEMLDDWLVVADARQIDFGVSRESLPIVGDPTLLRELLANLVDNALKYTPVGGQVTLEGGRADGWLVLEVVDNGPGIAPAYREQVMERFYRVPGATATGSGLGLPIAQEIVRCHGGTIAIATPETGAGTLVRVRLPAA